MTSALVLGAGGTVGIAYHVGVLRALEEVGGFVPNDADLVVGTSAGSMVGAMIRSGVSTEDLFASSIGVHPDLEIERDDASPWAAGWRNGADAVRRIFGSAYVLQRSMLRIPGPRLPRSLRRLFPGGFFTIADADEVLSQFMSTEWPSEPLWLVTVDVRTGRRVILGRRVPPRTDLHSAVRASCAIPAFFEPVRVGARTLVDGGVHSTTNVDLVSKIQPDVVLAVVPMAFDPQSPARTPDMFVRRFAQARLSSEVAQVRRDGAEVLMIRPSAEDLAAMGANMMRRSGNEVVTRVAYDSAARQLESPRGQRVLASLRATTAA